MLTAHTREDWLERVRHMLHQSLGNPLRVRDLAREVGVHPVHLGRAFRARYGTSVGDYHRRLRVRWASTLLTGNAAVGFIAVRAGFADHAHFCRIFKRVMGVTPRDYRASQATRAPTLLPSTSPLFSSNSVERH